MKKIFLLLVIAAMCFTSCESYLDIVPDNVTTVEDLFTTKTDARSALAKIYSYLPVIDDIENTPFLLGDEYVCVQDGADNNSSRLVGQRIMRNLQSLSAPLMDLWTGTAEAKHYYVGMRHCDLVIEHVDLVSDMTEQEKEEMKAQVKFLKAYYAFLLIKQYGPIVLPQYLDTDEDDPAKLFPARVTIDESFDYVISLMREAIPGLRVKVLSADYGQVDQTVAKSILAQVMVYRASPFFNGNSDLYGLFKNADEVHFFPQTEDKEKWKEALDALDEAIKVCEDNGIKLYEYYRLKPYDYDTAFFREYPDVAQNYYNRRFVVAEPWNSELVWGRSAIFNYRSNGENRIVSNACNIMMPDNNDYSDAGTSEKFYPGGASQTLSASYQMLERYYTENGLPIDEDKSFDTDEKYRITTVPGIDSPDYSKYVGLMQPDHKVIKLLLNREIRFYADLIITGGYCRSHRYKIKTSMFQDTDGGRSTYRHQTNYLCTGIGIQKLVHPESGAGNYFHQVRFPYPFIRLSDLYLMRAEARNAISGPGPDVWADVNKVRRKYGIKDVEVAWSSEYAKTKDKHKEPDGMLEIILQERSIEFAFEGIHYWDMVRYKKAVNAFSESITGWNTKGANAEDFFILQPVQYRRFSVASYLWPIPVDEMNINSNLINNPEWQ
jgi:hypothetical protein